MVYDAVVIGAGHNGLVAACLLAKHGLRVVVVERRNVVGGACVTEELIPGFRVSSAAYSFSLFRPEIAAELDLQRHGLTWYAKEPRMFVPLPNGRSFFVWRDTARTMEELKQIDEHDADAWPRWNAFWDEVVAVIRPLILADPPTPSALERQLLHKGKRELYRLAVSGSAADTVSHFFRSDEVRGITASQGIVGTFAGPRDPGTAFVMTYHAFGGEMVDGAGTWAYVRGGMGGVTQALASCARELGVEIRTHAPVAEILADRGRVRGVRLDGAGEIDAPLVLSNADPKRTFLRLLPSGSLPNDFEERVRSLPTTGSVIKVNMALEELPDFLGLPGISAGPEHTGTIEISPSIDYLEAAFNEAKSGHPSSRPFMEVFIQSATDDSLAPPGKHVVSCFAQYAPPACSSERWDQMREPAGDAIVQTLAGYAPNVTDAIIHREVLGPVDLEARFGLTGGNIFHGEILPSNVLGNRLGPRTPVAGLYLCGSGAHPGGGVSGAPGWNAARAVLADRAAAPA